jgi:hypothetical protein
MSDAETLRAVADRQAITDLIYRYCRSMDRIDAELGYTVWHEDGLADYGEGIFQGTGRGFVDWVCGTHRGMLVHSHQISNILIELDGERAGSEAYVTATLRTMAGDQMKQISTWCRYIDQWSKRNGRWGIDKRVTVVDFDEIRDVAPMSPAGLGARDRTDPSYAVLGAYPRGAPR